MNTPQPQTPAATTPNASSDSVTESIGLQWSWAAQSLSAYFDQQKVTLTVTLRRLECGDRGKVKTQVLEKTAERLDLARGIEPPTCGLQNQARGIAKAAVIVGNPLISLTETVQLPFYSVAPYQVVYGHLV